MTNRDKFLMLNRQDTQSYTNDDLQEEVIEDVELLESLGGNFGAHRITRTSILPPENKRIGTKSVGRTYRRGNEYQIILNEAYLKLTTDPVQVHSTIMHEVIHCMEGCWNHQAEFQKWAKVVNAVYGLKVKTRSPATEYIAQYVNPKVVRYAIFCPQCKQILARREKKSKIIKSILQGTGEYMCTQCGCRMLEIKEFI